MKDTWREGGHTIGAWLSIPSSLTAEVAGRAGFDYVCIDAQHGVIDYQVAATMLQAIELGNTTPLVRVQYNAADAIGKVLDAGARGVVVPMVNSVSEAQAAVAACRYAPEGSRSYGPTRVSIGVPNFTPAASNAAVACIPMIETAQAVEAIDDILLTPGIDAVYVGPADLSLTLGLPPRNNDGEPAFDEAMARIVAACDNAGVVAGCHTTTDLVERRLEQGFRMITAAADKIIVSSGFSAVAERFGLGGAAGTSSQDAPAVDY